MLRSRATRLAGALALLVLLVAPALPGAMGGRVLAHAQLVASSPGAGEVVPEAPGELRLVFSEPLEPELTSLDLRDATGEMILERAGAPDPEDAFALVVRLPLLADGTYSVTWRTLSAADGHTVQGFFAFGVGDVQLGPAGDGATSLDETDAIDVIGRFVSYVGLLGAVGLMTFAMVVIGRPVDRPLVRLVAAGLLVAGGATLVAALANAVAPGDVGTYLIGSRTGLLQLARAVVCLLAGGLLLVMSPRAAQWVAIGGGLTGIALLVAGGHAAALPGFVPVVTGIVHVSAAGVWLGGVAAVAMLGWRPSLLVSTAAPPMSTCVPRFSALALVSIGLAGASGILAAWWQNGAILDPSTPYGRTLLLKSALVVAALGIGAINYLDGGRAAVRAWSLARRVRGEAVLGVAVLAATAVLATTSPSTDSAGSLIEPVPDAFGAVAPEMTLSLAPGRPGVNRAVVETTDALAMSGVRLELVLDRLDDGTTTRAELHHPGMAGMDHGAGAAAEPGLVAWTADALVLPANSEWDANVLTLSSTGTELARQRYAFTMGAESVTEGRVEPIITPSSVIAGLLLLGGGLAIGLAFGGASLPRCDARASRIALRIGGGTALVLGVLVGLDTVIRM